ncbi:MAG: siphovirus Gp157 family protein [Methylococcaceae bacterium]|nr:siphovirus Gp157 family protein [Methylococcaceae bacterium]
MTLALYAIADEYRASLYDIQNTLEDIEIEDEEKQSMIVDSLSSIKDGFEVKALNVAGFIANLKLESIAVKTAEQRMTQRRRSLERQTEWLTDYLFCQLQKMDLKKLSNEQLQLTIKNNPAKVIVSNEDEIPKQFKETVTTTKVLKANIASAIKSGESIKGVYLEGSQRLDIR